MTKKIPILSVLLMALLTNSNVRCADRTFPGAEIIVPVVLPIIGSILPSIIPGFPGGGAGPPGVIPLPSASISHSTSIGTIINHKPIAISHSGSISTSPGNGATSSWGDATSSHGNHHVTVATGSTSSRVNNFQRQLNRWRRTFIKNFSFRRG